MSWSAKAFFAELGMELEGETTVPAVDGTVGLKGVRADTVVVRLRRHGPELVGELVSTGTATGSASCAGPRASSSDSPNSLVDQALSSA